jgi:hypothetical protein
VGRKGELACDLHPWGGTIGNDRLTHCNGQPERSELVSFLQELRILGPCSLDCAVGIFAEMSTHILKIP